MSPRRTAASVDVASTQRVLDAYTGPCAHHAIVVVGVMVVVPKVVENVQSRAPVSIAFPSQYRVDASAYRF